MSFLKSVSEIVVRTKSISIGSTSTSINQVRHATKRAAGSRTNKNDSAGRRLGPKAYDGHFVKPGQIIMRQRGTKIHPGENTDIGRDHTIFAIEPGYVRFYYDPFHPLRKYVGVALTRDTELPLPHFSPRMRRFGYEVIENPAEAKIEEDHMCRQEYLQSPELQQKQQELENYLNNKRSEFRETIPKMLSTAPSEKDLSLLVERLLSIYQLQKVGQSIEEAQTQTTYNYIYDLKLSLKRGELKDNEELNSLKEYYINQIANSTNDKLSIDSSSGKLCQYLSTEAREAREKEILNTLQSEFTGKIISKDDKKSILELIYTPGIFSKEEQIQLKTRFLPVVLPVSVPGTIKEEFNPKKPGKDITVVRIFDEKTKEVKVYGRTKAAFVPQD